MSLVDRTDVMRETAPAARRPWQAPTLDQLPRLVKLTLQTGGAGGAGGAVGGSVGGTGTGTGFGF